jgi:putative N6-adenine-specific DNA methylase
VVTCARGAAPVLAAELTALGCAAREMNDTAVETRGGMDLCRRLNLHLRTGHRVLYPLQSFRADTVEDVYRGCSDVPWEEVLRPDRPIAVRAAAEAADAGPGGRLAALKCKDAIVDRMRVRCGMRPDSGPEPRGACVFIAWRQRECRVFLDTTGVPLSFRGYRTLAVAAPMRESLAAAVILGTGWTGDVPFVNPMCGGGTLAIEAAWIAMRRAPGLLRTRFAFMSLRGFDANAWRADVDAALRTSLPRPGAPIVATDLDSAAVAAARVNARAAGVDAFIDFSACDVADTPVPAPTPLIVLNPEYGERMGADKDLEAEYRRIGRFLKEKGRGGRGVIVTGNLALSRRFGLKVASIRTLFNGPIECRCLEFDLSGPPGAKAPDIGPPSGASSV